MRPENYLTYWVKELGIEKNDTVSKNNIRKMLGYVTRIAKGIPNDFPRKGDKNEKN